MKRIISALIISLAFISSCTDDVALTPGISFLTSEPEVFEETAIFRVIGQPFSSIDSLTIPVVFGGTGVQGVDYDASADHFTFKGDHLTDSIVIMTKELGTGKTVSLSLQIPEGFVAGKHVSSEFRLQDKYGYLSFESAKGFIADTTSYVISLSDSTGRVKVLSTETAVDFTVNQEKSTAVEGVDFTIIDGSSTSFAAGTATAGFRIAPIGTNPREGKDKIVLNVSADKRFNTGEIAEMELSILRSDLQVLDGKWRIDTLVTDSLHFEKIWTSQCSGYSLVPEYKSSDMFEFSFLEGAFIPSFTSGFKYYFIGESTMEFAQEIEITDIEGKTKNIQLLSLDKTNRYFSDLEVSADTLSYVGIFLYQTEETQHDMMELYVLDHTSKSFMPELESNGQYAAEKPVATDPKLYLSATFSKY